ncbi:hypothetical protein BDU57DRAFT_374419 [Ampelomyces quisqualis]|uniref:Uncharacterized protein n=1 Tax=Ampelomyces quisqualis TaxID=50730 RepID=A0A6A5QCS1_AMPQU|nr:hypothetical protein BDU57DRAFT_374419 [Ampelomyces quisqualis]
MPIKPGDILAGVPGQPTTMISDGKRMRVLWCKAHGDGDPSPYLIERSSNTLAGHPTWKLFCGEIPDTIVREKNEPPRYVYLDDRACFDIWRSKKYSKDELKSFWPFDFDYIGNIKTARTNRGRPAYMDDSCTQYARGTLRGKKRMYVFSGAPDYTPTRNIKEATRDSEVRTEPASDNDHIEGFAVGARTNRPPNATTPSATSSEAIITDATIPKVATPNATSYSNSIVPNATAPFRSRLVSNTISSSSSYIDDAANGDIVLFDVAPNASQGSLHRKCLAGVHKSSSEAGSEEQVATHRHEKGKRKLDIEGMPFGKRTKW